VLRCRLLGCFVVATLLGSATAARAEDEPAEEETTSYRQYTLTADLVGISLLAGGGLMEGDDGRDTDASQALYTVGTMTALFATPAIHLIRGHGTRALGSLGMRAGLATLGALIAVSANSDCHSSLNGDLFCELDYMGYGILGGLVVASALDAALLTDEKVEHATWAPQVAATRDGVRVGATWLW